MVGIYFGKQQIDPAQFAYGQRKEGRKADNTLQYSREYIYFFVMIFRKARPFVCRVLHTNDEVKLNEG